MGSLAYRRKFIRITSSFRNGRGPTATEVFPVITPLPLPAASVGRIP